MLPTVAALMLVAAGCASPSPTSDRVVIVRDDPKPATTTAASVSVTASTVNAGMSNPIDPDPQQVEGQMAMVKPTPRKAPPKAAGHIAPTTTPMHLGGDVAPTFP